MAYEVGDIVMVDEEECEVAIVYGDGSGYAVETPDGTTKKVLAHQVSEVEEIPGEEPRPGEETPPEV